MREPVPSLSIAAYAAATLAPLPLLAAGSVLGGPWLWAALAYLGAISLLLDQLLPFAETDPPDAPAPPAAETLLVLLGLLSLALPVIAVAGAAGPSLSWPEKGALLFAAGLWLGQIGHPAAHELIHRARRAKVRLGVAVYAAMLIGHHASSHRLVHHRHVATPADPASAPMGRGFWRYLPRAAIGGFREGLRAENRLRRQRTKAGPHPYLTYALISAMALLCAASIAGPAGIALWLLLAAHVQLQIHLSDYVQHYGLTRRLQPDGRPEPVTARHSWNTAHAFSAALLLNAPRHSDHHSHPGRPYPALRLADDAPRLPWPLPLAAAIALIPPLWRRLMRPQLARIGARDDA